MADLEEANWRRVLDTNLTSVFLCLKHQIEAMVEHGGGAIVNMASVLGTIGAQRGASYVAAKHGVIGLTKAAALEVAERGVRVNAVAPGVVDTPLIHNTLNPATQTRMIGLHPPGRLGRAEEVAEWFASSSRTAPHSSRVRPTSSMEAGQHNEPS